MQLVDHETLLSLLKSDDFRIRTETDVVNDIEKWIGYDKTGRKVWYGSLMMVVGMAFITYEVTKFIIYTFYIRLFLGFGHGKCVRELACKTKSQQESNRTDVCRKYQRYLLTFGGSSSSLTVERYSIAHKYWEEVRELGGPPYTFLECTGYDHILSLLLAYQDDFTFIRIFKGSS